MVHRVKSAEPYDPNLTRRTADDASFQAFGNCYLREVDSGEWHDAAAWTLHQGVSLEDGERFVVQVATGRDEALAIGVRFRSRVGRHRLTKVFRRRGAGTWQPLDSVSAVLGLVDAIYAEQPHSEQRLELIARVVESHQVMARYLQRRVASAEGGVRSSSNFIESERAVLLGHWLHPTPKSRQGMHDWQHAHYAPELEGTFQLHFFAVDRSLVRQASAASQGAEQIATSIAFHPPGSPHDEAASRAMDQGRCLLPVHPLQAQWLLHQEHVRRRLDAGQLQYLGPMGAQFTPTSSVRTVYCETLGYMVKVSLPVKITNSLRINLGHELEDGVLVTRLLRSCGVHDQFPQLQSIEDPAYLTLVEPDMDESGFECIFRDNPFAVSASEPEASAVHTIAALVQDPVRPGEHSTLSQLVRSLADRQGTSLMATGLQWLEAYWHCAVEPVIRIFDLHGIALEAHQQNSLVQLDRAGCPARCYYRDLQGVALSASRRQDLLLHVPQLAHQPRIFEPDDIVRNGLGYYLVLNQLYAVMNRLALDGLVDEESSTSMVHRRLVRLRGEMRHGGVAFVDGLLHQRAIPCKANLLTRVEDRDELQNECELAVYTMVDNPLHRLQRIHRPTRAAPLGASLDAQ